MSDKALWDQFNANPKEVFARATKSRQADGLNDPPNIGQALEEFSPTEKTGDPDAFTRMMRQAGLVTREDRTAGYHPSTIADFMESPGSRALFVEFFRRTWLDATSTADKRKESLRESRAVLLSSDGTIGSWQRPYSEAASVEWNDQLEAEIPLSDLVGRTFSSASNAYRGFYIEYDAEQLRKFRVGESAEIPMAKIKGNEREIRLHKYGRGVEISYEDMATRVDRLAWIIRFMAVQSEMDKADAAISTIINGDGNPNTGATVLALSTLDADADPGELTLKAWRKFRLAFKRPYRFTSALMAPDTALTLELLNVGSANILAGPLGVLGLNPVPMNAPTGGIRYGWTEGVADDVILGYDRRSALHHIVMSGSQISETDRFITNQTHVLTMTEIEGFMVGDPAASKVLDLEAE